MFLGVHLKYSFPTLNITNPYLWSDGILDANNAQAGEVVDNILLVFPVGLALAVHLVDLGFARHKVTIGDRNGSQAVARHRLDHLPHQLVLHLASELLEPTVAAVDESASGHIQKF